MIPENDFDETAKVEDEEKKVGPASTKESTSPHWLDVAADFHTRMDRIEARQTTQATRLARLESGTKSIGDTDPMMQGVMLIMILGLAAQVLTPVLEAMVKKWSSQSS